MTKNIKSNQVQKSFSKDPASEVAWSDPQLHMDICVSSTLLYLITSLLSTPQREIFRRLLMPYLNRPEIHQTQGLASNVFFFFLEKVMLTRNKRLSFSLPLWHFYVGQTAYGALPHAAWLSVDSGETESGGCNSKQEEGRSDTCL